MYNLTSSNVRISRVKKFYHGSIRSGNSEIPVTINDSGDTCTCGDFAKNIKRDPDFKCKHILAVFNAVPKREVEGAVFLEKHVPRLDERWITKIEGKEFVKYPGLLDLAHQHGLSSIEVDIVQMPTKENGNFAVCRATVMSKIGEAYTDIGDANPNNCSRKVRWVWSMKLSIWWNAVDINKAICPFCIVRTFRVGMRRKLYYKIRYPIIFKTAPHSMTAGRCGVCSIICVSSIPLDSDEGDEALLNILNVPVRYVSNKLKDQLREFCRERDIHYYQGLKSMIFSVP